MIDAPEKLTWYKETNTFEEADVDILIQREQHQWKMLVKPFPIESDVIPVGFNRGQVTYTLGKPTKWGYVLHRF